jgi:predicted DNA-binding protein YlxM (UPF0122 family)
MTNEQKEIIKQKRLSGNFTLQEIADEFGVTKQRIGQLVGVGLRKHKKKVCVVCKKPFEVKALDRDRCKTICVPPKEPQVCIECKNSFVPLSLNNIARCQNCYPLYRRQKIYEYIRKSRLKRK